MENLDKQVMRIFDKEFEKMIHRIFCQVEEIWSEEELGELDLNKIDPYVCFYTTHISEQLKQQGVTPKDIPVLKHTFINYSED